MFKVVETENGHWLAAKTDLSQDELDKAYAEVHLKNGDIRVFDNIQHWNAAEAQERADELNEANDGNS